jgi:hypothetical protein
LIVLGVVVTLLGCHTMRFEVGDGQVGEVVSDRKASRMAALLHLGLGSCVAQDRRAAGLWKF